ncbi:uncharacterized protein EDB91DRAFT_1345365 [Suillus paluster]|uniref:uncharacterized protein n=1 Tax=Suillus paluster TaxID=48578 RepID=UPI001B883FA7|nr:uncharacterized protein EDB91DRAFT_1345365 [Suillus paluster]KAG1746586.1 hypothetical protein EDB91DRAFT_1345365 [Suillus paluster]
MISTLMNVTARVALSNLLTVAFFKRTVVDHTVEVLSKAEKVSAGLVVYTVCSSSIMLVLASDRVAQKFLHDDTKNLPTPKDDDADRIPPFSDDNTSAAPQPAEIFSFPSASSESLRLIDTIAVSITCSTTCISLTSPHCKYLSIDSNTTSNTTVSSDDASDASNCELFGDDSIFHENDFSAPEQTTLDALVAKMQVLTLDDHPHTSTLHPFILVVNRETTSTSPPSSLPELANSMDALIRSLAALSLSDGPPDDSDISLPDSDEAVDASSRSMKKLSLSDPPPSASKLKPPILVTKRAAAQLKFLPPTSTPHQQPITRFTRDVTTPSSVPYDLELYRPRGWRPPPLPHSHTHLRITYRRRWWSPTTNPDDTPYHVTASYDPELRRLSSRRPLPVYASASLGPLRPKSNDALNGLLRCPSQPEVRFEGRHPSSRTHLSKRIIFRFILPIKVFLICILLNRMRRTVGLSLACFFLLLFSFPTQTRRHL